ncbi:MAG: hypothetical protein IT369_06865 [Candidatus Latescibacteria bacterium]|nr:hypothetical protein [Candidatus Latescibacterota bacterium]
MRYQVLLSPIFTNPQFDTPQRQVMLKEFAALADLEYYTGDLTPDKAKGVIGVIADSAVVHDGFYTEGQDLRVIARWGVGFDKVNVAGATKNGVLITVAPEHMETVAEYAITQWLATLKRVYTLNRLSHSGDFSIIRTYEAQDSTLGIYGLGRIGQAVARRAKPLLGAGGRLLVYDVRPDIKELAASLGAEAVDHPRALFEQCDTVTLHVSGDQTVVTYDLLCAMQPHASLINPSRGNLVDDQAVNRAIREEKLCYYVVDDPVNGPRAIHKDHPRIICTNHNAGITVQSTIRLDRRTIGQVADAIAGKTPAHVLNHEVLDHPRVRGFLKD